MLDPGGYFGLFFWLEQPQCEPWQETSASKSQNKTLKSPFLYAASGENLLFKQREPSQWCLEGLRLQTEMKSLLILSGRYILGAEASILRNCEMERVGGDKCSMAWEDGSSFLYPNSDLKDRRNVSYHYWQTQSAENWVNLRKTSWKFCPWQVILLCQILYFHCLVTWEPTVSTVYCHKGGKGKTTPFTAHMICHIFLFLR